MILKQNKNLLFSPKIEFYSYFTKKKELDNNQKEDYELTKQNLSFMMNYCIPFLNKDSICFSIK